MDARIIRGATLPGNAAYEAVPADVVIEDERVVHVAPAGAADAGGRTVTEATGLLLLPGLVDIQVHFREPGTPEAEDVASGAAAAASGGMTAVVMMPNTTPPLDNVDIVRAVLRSGDSAPVEVHTSACITRGRAGEELVDVDALHAAGVRVFTDDGNSVMNARLMRQALRATTRLPGMVVSQHCEDESLVAGGAVNEGPVAERFQVGGRPAVAEEIIVARDIALAADTGGRYHVLHLSAAGSLEQVRRAKAAGLAVTCEVTPQHLVLTETAVERLGTHGKMNPPLRTDADVESLRMGLVDGTVDAVATDHAPHAPDRKAAPLADAPPGMLGVETAASVVWTHLVHPGIISAARAVEVLSSRPAAIVGLADHGGPITAGMTANLCLFDPAHRWTVAPEDMASRSRNDPFAGEELTGRAVLTLLRGTPTLDRL
ncbi:dihydroorotase [Euzebya tangerina]|uniref:dihydroorotase n=1 Tax=Euzebya tangerina TaxID=591198 RepID=UPI000E31CBA8|nr:dihydroorotase [Euzebya tangerina]